MTLERRGASPFDRGEDSGLAAGTRRMSSERLPVSSAPPWACRVTAAEAGAVRGREDLGVGSGGAGHRRFWASRRDLVEVPSLAPLLTRRIPLPPTGCGPGELGSSEKRSFVRLGRRLPTVAVSARPPSRVCQPHPTSPGLRNKPRAPGWRPEGLVLGLHPASDTSFPSGRSTPPQLHGAPSLGSVGIRVSGPRWPLGTWK